MSKENMELLMQALYSPVNWVLAAILLSQLSFVGVLVLAVGWNLVLVGKRAYGA